MKKPLIIASLFVAVFVIMLVLSLVSPKEKTNTITPTPTPLESNIDGPPTSRGDLRVTNILPQEGGTYLPFQKITVTFNVPILMETVAISTSPLTEIKILKGSSQNEVFIVPATTWRTGKTTVTISRAISQDSTVELASPVVFSLTTSLPTLSPEELEQPHP